MKCRKNLKNMSPTELNTYRDAVLRLKDAALNPSQLPDAQAEGATSRYDDYIWMHHKVMMDGPNDPTGPNFAHRGPAFLPWHRELLKRLEQELRTAIGNPNLTIPYWDWTKAQTSAAAGWPFTNTFLGPDGVDAQNDRVTVGDFAQANGKWDLNVDEDGFGFLRRQFAEDALAPNLPTAQNVKDCLALTTYDVSPWSTGSSGANSFRNRLEGWAGPQTVAMHNRVHVWIGGSMAPGTSPNDPVFFLHHCNIDRLWAVWQQKHPAVAQYLPDNTTPAASGLTRLNDNMATFGDYFGANIKPADTLNHKAITWYDSDLPEITLETNSLDFGNVPETLITFRAARFKVKTCRQVRFRITGVPTGNFGLTPMGTEFQVDPVESENFVYAYVWVSFTSNPGPNPPSGFDIESYLVDDEGYYAATDGGEFHIDNYHVDLSASSVPRIDNSIVLVLDRSGSMAANAGGSNTRSSLLKSAVSVFVTLMRATDEIGIVSFDDQVATLQGIITVGGGGSASVSTILMGNGLDPRGETWIGGGIETGRTVLGSASAGFNQAMLVLTDGNQNVHPYINELPAGNVDARTYAIGFGLPGQVSLSALQDITQNTNGDLSITGSITSDEQRFLLTKYFVQMLAGITKTNIILDPQGELALGSIHTIPFDVSETDVSIDVVGISPLPFFLDLQLKTPAGSIIDPMLAASEANISFIEGEQAILYRINLPALPLDPVGSHAGAWTAILKIVDRDKREKLLASFRERKHLNALTQPNQRGTLPYSLVVQTYSNLTMEAHAQQNSYEPGAELRLFASLKEYDVPVSGRASVWAEVTRPDQSLTSITLNENEGQFQTTFPSTLSGVYKFRVRAEGTTFKGSNFTREKTVTCGVFQGGDAQGGEDPGIVGWLEGRDKKWCELLGCLSQDCVRSRLLRWLLRKLFHVDRWRHCLKEHCSDKG